MPACICSSRWPSPSTILASAIFEELGGANFSLRVFGLARTPRDRLKFVLPKSPDAVGFKDRLVTDHRNVFRLRLSDQHAVKRVFVRTGQKAGSNAMLGGNRQQLEPLAVYASREVGHEVADLVEFSQLVFDRKFPSRCGAD